MPCTYQESIGVVLFNLAMGHFMRTNHRYAGKYRIIGKGLEYRLLDVEAVLNKDDSGVFVGYCGCNYIM